MKEKDDPIYTALYDLYRAHGLWEGDAHQMAEVGTQSARWLLDPRSGSGGSES